MPAPSPEPTLEGAGDEEHRDALPDSHETTVSVAYEGHEGHDDKQCQHEGLGDVVGIVTLQASLQLSSQVRVCEKND